MNNYDMSSKGEDINFLCHYDIDLASIYYDDFNRHEATRLDVGRNSAVFLVGDCHRPYYTKAMLRKLSKKAIFDLCEDYDLLGYSCDIDRYKRAEYEADLLGVTIKQHYEYLIAQHGWNSLGEAIPHDWYISRGYSQGDAVFIVSLDKPIDDRMRQNIDHVLWDCPIAIRATIDDKEFYEDDFLNEAYEWDADEVKAKIKALPISDYAKGFLIDSLPDYPCYL